MRFISPSRPELKQSAEYAARPNSLPVVSNHSCRVCAPPPAPPAPMAMASRPSEIGMLASVDARCTFAVLPRCASTARAICRILALGCSSPPGRLPMTHDFRLPAPQRQRRIVVLAAANFFLLDRPLDRAAQFQLQPFDFKCRGRTDIHPHAGRLRNRIHRGASVNHPNIESSLRRRRNPRLRKKMDRPRQRNDRIGSAEVAPRMPARTAKGHFKSPAAQSFRDNSVGAGAVDHNACGDRILPLRIGKNCAHTAQIAFTLFTDVADKQQRTREARNARTAPPPPPPRAAP